MTRRNLIPCPAASGHPAIDGKGCATMLQRSADGDLIDGVALHLKTVHHLEAPAAVAIARKWVRQQP